MYNVKKEEIFEILEHRFECWIKHQKYSNPKFLDKTLYNILYKSLYKCKCEKARKEKWVIGKIPIKKDTYLQASPEVFDLIIGIGRDIIVEITSGFLINCDDYGIKQKGWKCIVAIKKTCFKSDEKSRELILEFSLNKKMILEKIGALYD